MEFNFSAQNTLFLLSIRTTFVSLPPKTVVSVPLNKVVYDLHRSLTMGSRNQGFGANLEQINKNSPPSYLEGLLTCSGRESNPYGHCCPRDFKSRVSTYSTTKAIRVQRYTNFAISYRFGDFLGVTNVNIAHKTLVLHSLNCILHTLGPSIKFYYVSLVEYICKRKIMITLH